MSAANGLRALWLPYFSQPASDRIVYRAIRRRKVRKIVEIGIGDAQRAMRMISLAQRYQPTEAIRYIGIDPFEAEAAAATRGMTLKSAYRLLKATGARVHLVPSDAPEAFPRAANALMGNQLVLISSAEPPMALLRMWLFLPRMLAPEALVLFDAMKGPRSMASHVVAGDSSIGDGTAPPRRLTSDHRGRQCGERQQQRRWLGDGGRHPPNGLLVARSDSSPESKRPIKASELSSAIGTLSATRPSTFSSSVSGESVATPGVASEAANVTSAGVAAVPPITKAD